MNRETIMNNRNDEQGERKEKCQEDQGGWTVADAAALTGVETVVVD